MGKDKGKARKSLSPKRANFEKKVTTIIEKELKSPPPVITHKRTMGIKKGGSKSNFDKVASKVAKDVNNMAQFGGKAAKEVVKDVQGLAKMVMKGFGN